MELRQLTLEDRPAMQRLMAEAFEGGRRPSEEAPAEGEAARLMSSVYLGLFDGARLVAAAIIHALPVAWGEQTLTMGGIAGVACAADQRGRGHVARLLAASLVRMRDAGQVLSGLYPFAWAFYRKHGWEWVGEKREFTVPTAAIPSHPEGRNVKMYDGLDALEIVKPIHAASARRYQGMTTRENLNPNWWNDVLGPDDGRTTYVHVHSDAQTGQADGYLTFRFPDGGETGRVGDFFTLTPAAYQGLLSVLHYYGTQVEKVRWVFNTDQSFKASQPEVQIRLDRTRAAEYGLSMQQVAQAVSNAVQGNIDTKFRDPLDSEQYDIRVQLQTTDRNSIYTVGQIPVGYQNGNPILLGNVANVSLGAAPTRVDRLNRLREISVTGYLMPVTQIGNVGQQLDR
ncbi:MAG: GNAT family N-acetyltransferase, partial [Armatimonadota bacterium]|nr:GNAT family N-acetyltransferase [Armatimonadota bacterium]